MTTETKHPGLLRKAPENFLNPQLLREIHEKGLDEERRLFLRQSFLVASAATAVSSASKSFANEMGAGGSGDSAAGDPNILVLPSHSTTLGKPVTQAGYGQPSRHENAILKRISPGLTRTQEASASFTPLQALFGIITPNGLHFERHHQGWHDIAPDTHRLMIHGLVKTPMIFTMDDLMRLPSVSRIHFLECGANTAMEWGHPSVPTVQYTHGMLSCCEFTGVPLSLLLDYCGYDKQESRFILA
jgi:sulfane dehydrogenase subunit SoxC